MSKIVCKDKYNSNFKNLYKVRVSEKYLEIEISKVEARNLKK